MKKSITFCLLMAAVCTLQAQNMGIGIANPSEKLDVDGALKIGYTTNANEGAIRYNPTTKEFEGFDGTIWKAFSPGSVSTDNLGNHTATQNLDMESFRIIDLADPIGNQNAATKAYVDANGADDMGNHKASQNVELNGKWLSNDGGNEGIQISNAGRVGIGVAAGSSASTRIRGISGDPTYFKVQNPATDDYFEVANDGKIFLLSGAGINEFSIDGTLAGNSDVAVPTEQAVKTYVDANGTDDLGNHKATQNVELNGNWLSNDGDSEGIRIHNSGNVGIGVDPNINLSVLMKGISGDNSYLRVEDPTGTNYFDLANNGKIFLVNGTGIDEFSTDGTLAGNSDDALPTEKAVKTYVDAEISAIPSSADNLGNHIAAQNLNMSSFRITNLFDPTSSQHAATKAYVDAEISAIPSSADNLGNHTSTQNIELNGNWLSNDGDDEGIKMSNAGRIGIGVAPNLTTSVRLMGISGDASYFKVQDPLANNYFEIANDGRVYLLNGTGINEFSKDITLAGNSNDAVPTEQAVKAYVDANGADNMGNHRATQHIELNNKWLSNDGDNEGIKITDAGRVGIGAIAPSNVTMYLEGISGDDFYFVVQDPSGDRKFEVRSDNKVVVGETASSAHKFSVNGTAAKAIGGTTWGTYSDRRLKKDIKPYTDGLTEVMQINPVRFYYNDVLELDNQDKEEFGIIAQELMEVAPYMVDESVIETNGEEVGTYYTVNNGAMTYMLVNGMQEQQELIEQLQAENAALKAENETVKAENAAQNTRLEAIEQQLGMGGK